MGLVILGGVAVLIGKPLGCQQQQPSQTKSEPSSPTQSKADPTAEDSQTVREFRDRLSAAKTPEARMKLMDELKSKKEGESSKEVVEKARVLVFRYDFALTMTYLHEKKYGKKGKLPEEMSLDRTALLAELPLLHERVWESQALERKEKEFLCARIEEIALRHSPEFASRLKDRREEKQ